MDDMHGDDMLLAAEYAKKHENLVYYTRLSVYITCITNIVLQLISVYIISKYKNLRKPENRYILNWFVSSILELICELFLVMHIFDNDEECIFNEIIASIEITNVSFMMIMLFNWMLRNSTLTLFRKHSIVIIILTWLQGVILVTVLLTQCSEHITLLISSENLIDIFELSLAGFTIALLIMTKCSNPFCSPNRSIPLSLATLNTILVLICNTVIIVIELYVDDENHPRTAHLLQTLIVVAMLILIPVSALGVLIVMCCMDKQFHMFMLKTFGYVNRTYGAIAVVHEDDDDDQRVGYNVTNDITTVGVLDNDIATPL